ncbi:AAA family ATPase [Candidatus Uhrbacteria bacterium]|jgi:predicted kinase|nr:AAA family ATPase [Candidatus Uhrbacteria bacterium]
MRTQQKLIVISGAPATGKTTLSAELSALLNIACLNKDAIKERLYELMELSTLEDSRRVGLMAFKLFLHLIEIQLQRGVDLIIESPFAVPGDNEMLAAWQEQYGLRLICIECTVDPKIRATRFETRPRHASHHDTDRMLVDQPMDTSTLLSLPGEVIRVDTNRPNNEVVSEVLAAI